MSWKKLKVFGGLGLGGFACVEEELRMRARAVVVRSSGCDRVEVTQAESSSRHFLDANQRAQREWIEVREYGRQSSAPICRDLSET